MEETMNEKKHAFITLIKFRYDKNNLITLKFSFYHNQQKMT